MLTFWSSNARSEVGISYFAIQHKRFPCSTALSVYDGVKKPSLSFLWSTFGTSTKCIDKLVATGKPITLQIHASNGSCVRLGRCKAGEVDIRNQGKYVRRIRQIKAYTDTLPKNVSVLLSLQLEDNMSYQQSTRALSWARKVWSGDVSTNPVKVVRAVPGALLELHDSFDRAKKRGASVWSNDGVDINFGKGCTIPHCVNWSVLSRDVLKHRRSFKHSFLWWNTQGAKDGKNHIPPRKRKLTVHSKDVSKVNALLRRIKQ